LSAALGWSEAEFRPTKQRWTEEETEQRRPVQTHHYFWQNIDVWLRFCNFELNTRRQGLLAKHRFVTQWDKLPKDGESDDLERRFYFILI